VRGRGNDPKRRRSAHTTCPTQKGTVGGADHIDVRTGTNAKLLKEGEVLLVPIAPFSKSARYGMVAKKRRQ